MRAPCFRRGLGSDETGWQVARQQVAPSTRRQDDADCYTGSLLALADALAHIPI